MAWPWSIFVGILTAAIGLIASAVVAGLAASWYRVPSFEAQSAAFVISLALLGAIAGFIIGLITSRVMTPGAGSPFLKALGTANGIELGTIAIVGIAAWLLADIPPTIDGEQLMLAVELRWPESQTTSPATIPGEPTLTLGTVTRLSHTQRATSKGPLWTSDAHRVEDRWVAPGAVDLFTTRGRLTLTAAIDSTTNPGFLLPLPGRPSKDDLQWTEWFPHARPGTPPLADGFQYRYRVQKRSAPVRTETIGSFEVRTIASYFYGEMIDGKTELATRGRFTIWHNSEQVKVEARDDGSASTGEQLELADGVAVLAGATPALFAHFIDDAGSTGACYALTDSSHALEAVQVPKCGSAAGSILTSDTTAFRRGERKVVSGRINHIAFETPGLYNVGDAVLDTKRLAVYPYTLPENFSIFPDVPPLGISPDERSFVRFGSHYDTESRTSIAVVDFVGKRSYTLPVDEARMRYPTLDAIDPAWLMHHFTWLRGAGGVDSLVERPGFVPLPYHGRWGETGSYWYEPAREQLRDAIIDLLVTEYKGKPESVESYAYEHPVRIDGQVINVAYGSSGNYVSVSIPRDATDRTLLEAIAKRLDTVIATGKYDALFGK